MSDCRAYRCHPGTDATRFGLLCEKCWQKLSDDGQAKIAEMAMGLDVYIILPPGATNAGEILGLEAILKGRDQ